MVFKFPRTKRNTSTKTPCNNDRWQIRYHFRDRHRDQTRKGEIQVYQYCYYFTTISSTQQKFLSVGILSELLHINTGRWFLVLNSKNCDFSIECVIKKFTGDIYQNNIRQNYLYIILTYDDMVIYEYIVLNNNFDVGNLLKKHFHNKMKLFAWFKMFQLLQQLFTLISSTIWKWSFP